MASMEELAKHFGDDPGHWKAIGYLHDYEQYPDEHLKHTEQPLKEAGLEDAEIRAILAHGYGIVNSFRNKTLKDPIIGEYQRAYKRLYARERTGKITKEELDLQVKKATLLRDNAVAGSLELQDYIDQITKI
jgi:hypothetical protein